MSIRKTNSQGFTRFLRDQNVFVSLYPWGNRSISKKNCSHVLKHC